MPTYEYRCAACGHEFERFQSIKADPIRTCPRCKKRKVERLISGGGAVLFKGSGFYETDYRSESYKKAAEAEKKTSEPGKDGGGSAQREKSQGASQDAAKGDAGADHKKTNGNGPGGKKPNGKKTRAKKSNESDAA